MAKESPPLLVLSGENSRSHLLLQGAGFAWERENGLFELIHVAVQTIALSVK